ncbi:MAG: hypothetical protein ACFE0Q_11800 [Anaerolineae bacterium]
MIYWLMTRKSVLPFILIILIIWLASATRFYQLGAQSLWYDEGVAFGHSQRNLLELIPRLQNNVHVPAYFGSLALYEDAVGATEFGLRSYSVLWSVLGVAAVYALGKRLFHPIAALSAALLVALNGFSVYYAQETRMYAMLATVATLSMWAFVGWARLAFHASNPPTTRRLWQWGIAFSALNTLGAYTHISFALVMLSQGVLALFLLAHLLNRSRQSATGFGQVGRVLLTYVAVNLGFLVLFLPWIFTAISQISAQPNISQTYDLASIIRIIQGWFAFGISFEAGTDGMAVVMYFLLLFGLLSVTDERPIAWWALLLPVVWVLVSVSLYLYLELYARYLRFLLPAQIGFALWMGRGVWVLWSIVPRTLEDRVGWQRTATAGLPRVAALVAILAFGWQQFTLLNPLYHDATYQRDDYRGLVAQINAEARPDDAIILSAPGLQEIFGYYYDAPFPVYTLPASPNIADDTQAIIDAHERLYVVWYGQAEQDPDGIVSATLNQQAFPISGEWVGDVRFERFATPAEFSEIQTLDLAFGEAITLQTLAINGTTFSANDVVQLQLEWMTDQALDVRYKIFLHLVDEQGVPVIQRDSEPAGNQLPTIIWQAGQTVQDNHALTIPSELPAGEYRLLLGLYDSNQPTDRLPVVGGDAYTVAIIRIE